MPESDAWDEAVSEVERRVAEGRESGRYPEELDAQLESDFARAAKDPLRFERLDAAREQLVDLSDYRFGRDRIELTSSVPGGSGFHRVVGKTVSRSVSGVLGQLSDLSSRVQSILEAVLDANDEIRSVVVNDVLGDIDELHHRMAAIERRLGRLEASGDAADGADTDA
jgi:hypothetical protein